MKKQLCVTKSYLETWNNDVELVIGDILYCQYSNLDWTYDVVMEDKIELQDDERKAILTINIMKKNEGLELELIHQA